MKTKKNKKNTKFKPGRSDRPDQSNQSQFVQCLDKVFELLFRNYTLYSESIDDYIQKKKPSLRRSVIYHTITVNLLVASIINLYLSQLNHSDRGVTLYLGAPLTFLLVNESDWYSYFKYSILLIIIVIFRGMVFQSERRFQNYAIDLFYEIKQYGLKVNKINKNNFDRIFLALANAVNHYLLYAFTMVVICFTPYLYLTYYSYISDNSVNTIHTFTTKWLIIFGYFSVLMFTYVFLKLLSPGACAVTRR